MSELIASIEEICTAAGAVLMKHYGNLEHIDKKGEVNLVTVADRESEALIKRMINERYPGHQVLGEETGEDYAGRGEEYRWVVDPLDGTTNFAHSFPAFCVSIGVERRGETVAAGIFAPYYGEMFLAERGAGARLNGKPLRVSRVGTLAESLVVTGFPYYVRDRLDITLEWWRRFLGNTHGMLRMGAAALDMCAVASGRLEVFWQEGLLPWDTAAGLLVVEEAGGRVTDFAGGKFSPYGKQVLASNGLVHDECVALLAE